MKALISANVVRDEHKAGHTEIAATPATAIITPEARSIAAQLGISFVDKVDTAGADQHAAAVAAVGTAGAKGRTPDGEASATASRDEHALYETVRAQVMARLPAGSVPEAVVRQMIEKVMKEGRRGAGNQEGRMGLIESCAHWCRQHPKRIAFPDALDERALKAASELSEGGYMHPVLLGNSREIRALAQSKGIVLGAMPIIDPASSPQLDKYSELLHARLADKGVTLDQARHHLREPLWYGAMMLKAGDIDCTVAGNLSSTASVLQAALRVVGPAKGIKTVSSLFFMIAPGAERILGFADCGVVPTPTNEQLADIAISSADNYRRATGDEPRVAMLSFSTMGSVRHPAVTPVKEAVHMVRERRPDLLIEGELQFDAAFVPDVAQRKVDGSVLGGRANVFVFPDLNSGNIAYKITERLGGYSALGPMIQGLALPMHDLSRGCSTRDMVEVSLLAMKMAFYMFIKE